MERWLKIQEFPRYSISDQGRVRNDDNDRLMTLLVNHSGVVSVYLVRDGRQYNRGVAKLVATHFLPHSTDIANTPMHLDGDRTNNAADNLIWRPRWYATKYLHQFERHRVPFVGVPIVEEETGLIFKNSWDATTYFGILEADIAHSFHAYEGRGEIVRALPTNYRFRKAV